MFDRKLVYEGIVIKTPPYAFKRYQTELSPCLKTENVFCNHCHIEKTNYKLLGHINTFKYVNKIKLS